MKTPLTLLITSVLSFSTLAEDPDLRQISYPLPDFEGNVEFYPITVEVVGDSVYWEGDILIGYLGDDGEIILYGDYPDAEKDGGIGTFNVILNGYRWPNGVVPYTIAPHLQPYAASIRQAMDTIEQESGVHFIPRASHSNYVTFREHPSDPSSCSANLGMRGGQQFVNLGPGCMTQGVILHEILHALGFRHTHSRSDRNSYVQIHQNNIIPGREHNFDIANPATHQNVGPYDYRSVMHYHATAFSHNGQPTITRRSNPGAALGGSVLTNNDKSTLIEMYGRHQYIQLSAQSFFCYGDALLTWTEAPSASSYRVQISYGANLWSNITGLMSTRLLSVSADQPAIYRVVACDDNGECEPSSNMVNVQYYPICY